MKIIRGELADDQVIPPSTRYDSTCNCIQVTPDGGSTWTEAVGQDPRTQPAYLKPPVAGSNKKCDAAANMTKFIHDIVDGFVAALTAGATDLLLVNGFIQFVELLFPFAAYFIQLMFELAVDVLATGATDLATAFDSATYDALECIFFCRADDNGQFTPSTFLLVGSDVAAQLNTTAAVIVAEILFILGYVGLNNAGAIGSQTGDCSGCDACAWEYYWDLTATNGLFLTDPDQNGYAGAWSSGNGWQCVTHGDSNGCGTIYEVDLMTQPFDMSADTVINAVTEVVSAGTCGHNEVYIGATRPTNLHMYFYASSWGSPLVDNTTVISGANSGIHFGLSMQQPDSNSYIRSLRVAGTGTMPDFTGGIRTI